MWRRRFKTGGPSAKGSSSSDWITVSLIFMEVGGEQSRATNGRDDQFTSFSIFSGVITCPGTRTINYAQFAIFVVSQE